MYIFFLTQKSFQAYIHNFYLLIAVAPSFDTHLLNDLVVRAGQSPKPKATWTRDGVQIVADARHEMYTTNTETSFEIPFSVRGDTGRYTLTLENEHGNFRYLTKIEELYLCGK